MWFSRPKDVVLAALTGILLGSLVWAQIFKPPHDPVYRGKTLSVWLRTYAASSSSGRHSPEWNEANDAVRHMGTNCLPVLLQMLGTRDSKLTLSVVAWARIIPLLKINFIPAAEWNVAASRAFIALGDIAKGAVAPLVKIYNANISPDSRSAVGDVLG